MPGADTASRMRGRMRGIQLRVTKSALGTVQCFRCEFLSGKTLLCMTRFCKELPADHLGTRHSKMKSPLQPRARCLWQLGRAG